MAKAFDSRSFFTDEFFAGDGTGTDTATSATISGTTYDCIFNDGFDPKKYGQLAVRPGHWATLFIPQAQLDTQPTPQTVVTIDGVDWRVDSASSNGDLWEIMILTSQRKG